jgi:hypothetical protein
MSTAATDQLAEGALRVVAASLLGREVGDVIRAGEGGNNRLYRFRDANGRPYALKRYFQSPEDTRDRLGAEFDGLSFLGQKGLKNVPEAVACCRENHVAIYDWIDGQTIDRVDVDDIDTALGFLGDLHAVARQSDTAALPLASEACLSLHELGRQIERRYARLRKVYDSDLQAFLKQDFLPVLEACWHDGVYGYERAGLDPTAEIELGQQTLSPSDFGFHNALRGKTGIVFLDFEYFGRDDPAKLTADFLLHPGMRLSCAALRRFMGGCLEIFADDGEFEARMRNGYPLYALRWCLILLNEFLPERWARRAFAGTSEDRAAVCERQMRKARAVLERAELINKGIINHG